MSEHAKQFDDQHSNLPKRLDQARPGDFRHLWAHQLALLIEEGAKVSQGTQDLTQIVTACLHPTEGLLAKIKTQVESAQASIQNTGHKVAFEINTETQALITALQNTIKNQLQPNLERVQIELSQRQEHIKLHAAYVEKSLDTVERAVARLETSAQDIIAKMEVAAKSAAAAAAELSAKSALAQASLQKLEEARKKSLFKRIFS